MKVKEIKERMDGVNIEGRITRISKPTTMDTRYGPALYAQAVLEDETGSIKLNLWRGQVAKVAVGRKIKIEGGFTKFGELNVGSGGKLILL